VAVTEFDPAWSDAVVKVAVPLGADGYGVFKVAVPSTVVTPLFSVEKLTAPTTLLEAVTVTPNETLAPAKTFVDDGVIAIELDARDPSHAIASALAFTDPNPVTWSYPVPAENPN
jgi:hypothetical protein